MPHKPKRKPPPPASTCEQVSLQNYETFMAQFIKYYKGLDMIGEEEWKHFIESLLSNLPVSYRIAERSRRMNNIYEGKPGTVSEAEVLREFLKTTILPKVSDVTIDDEPFKMTPIPWYPKQMAWQTNVDAKTFSSCKELKPVGSFTSDEERMFNIFKQDLTSMIPALLVDIHPHHKILQLMPGPGYCTAQILEQMFANPKQTPDGVLIANDRDSSRMQYRWNLGSNILFTHKDPETFPDFYTTEEHDQDSKLTYDRIFVEPPTSADGAMRSVHKVRLGWNVVTAQKNHAHQKQILRRGLELLEVNGQLVYITSSMNPIENEAVVAALLDESPETLELVDVRKRLPGFHTRDGMTSWKVMSQGLVFYETYEASPAWFQKENDKTLFPPENVAMYNLDRCVRVMPHDNNTGAMFVAVFTKLGPVSWLKDDDEEAEMETADGDEDGVKAEKKDGDDKKEEEEKSKYILPIRCDISVAVAEVEWTTEFTDEDLNTTTDVSSSTYELGPLQISRHCIPQWLQKKMKEMSATYQDMPKCSSDWEFVKKLFDIKKFDPEPCCLQFVQDGKTQVLNYCSPLLRQIVKYNPKATKKTRGFSCGLAMLKATSSGIPEIVHEMSLLPYMNKRLVDVPRVDMVEILQEREVVFTKLTNKTKAELEAMDAGMMFFIYTPKGKNADPKCTIYAKREKFTLFVKDPIINSYRRNHGLRLCGVDPREVEEESTEEVKQESMETE